MKELEANSVRKRTQSVVRNGARRASSLVSNFQERRRTTLVPNPSPLALLERVPGSMQQSSRMGSRRLSVAGRANAKVHPVHQLPTLSEAEPEIMPNVHPEGAHNGRSRETRDEASSALPMASGGDPNGVSEEAESCPLQPPGRD